MTQTSSMQFTRATKQAARLRMAIDGPAGAGKTYTALAIASALATPVALVDTEHGSASKYADLFDFATLQLESFHPERFMEAIDAAESAGFGVLILDSLSHAWTGKDGTLELVDRAARRSQSQNSFAAWKDVTPIQNALVERILSSRLHIIATLRVKTEYVIQTNDRGRQEPRKIGLAPIQRDQIEYEFDVYGRLDQDNTLVVTKSRCPALAGGVFQKPGAEVANVLKGWLQGSAPQNGHANGTVAPRAPEPKPESNGKTQSMVTDTDDPMWQRWLSLKAEAESFDLEVEDLALPIGRANLQSAGLALRKRIEECKKQGVEPMVLSTDHPLWKEMLNLEKRARAVDLEYTKLSLPITEVVLKASVETLAGMIVDKERAV